MSKQISEMTDFEKLVLEYTKKIPKGKITTYQFLAKAIKRPKSVRAVGNALNKNPMMIKIPCHRVIRSDGFLGGFGKGPAMKREILKKEGILFDANNKIIDLKKFIYKF